MIVELFGPPAAGKTTIAKFLTTQLRESGHAVEPIISNRPAEWDGAKETHTTAAAGLPSLVRRLARPIIQSGAALCVSTRINQSSRALMQLDPPVNMFWQFRLKQYLMRLASAWDRASRADHVVLFDQGYVQFACSLNVRGDAGDLRQSPLH